ncbi:MAG: carboxypeptidase regulatory-like domain-containing protein [Candidatus Binatia bacterium]
MPIRPLLSALILLALSAEASLAYQAVAVVDGGSVTGTVTFKGTVPPRATIAVTKDPEVCGREKTASSLLVSPKKGIQNVVVRLKDIRAGKALAKTERVTVTQKGCEYAPRVVVFPAGSRVRIENEDGILHNTNATAEVNESFTVAQPKFRRVIEKRIEEPEMPPIRVRCDVHSWMASWWISQEHPYYAVSDADGAFTLTDIPPGDYTLESWHETLGTVTQKIAVAAKTPLHVSVEMTKK